MKILITGGCGFIGSNLALAFKLKFPKYKIIVLDNLKRRGSELNIPRLTKHGIIFIHGDVRNLEDFDDIGEIDFLIEASAEPSVLAGISSSLDYLINTNLIGAINCFNYAKKYNAGIIFLSTSRVYPIKYIEKINYYETDKRFELDSKQVIQGVSERGINECFPIDSARSFYGATKYSAEIILQEFNEFFKLKTVINRCGIITGPFQMGRIDQGVVVLWVAKHFWKKQLSYIGYDGSGKQVRDILHVDDLFNLINMQLHDIDKFNGDVFNIGGGKTNSLSLKELTELCNEITGNKLNIKKVKETRNADIPIYITDISKVEKISGWRPKILPKDIIFDIYKWISENQNILKEILI